MAFQPVEDELKKQFSPGLFQGAMYQIPGGEINGLPVKQAEIALTNPTQTAGAN